MGFHVSTSIPTLTVFIQGLLSFFSPCVLPLVPLYIGYLAGGAKTVGEDGVILYRKGKVMLNTVFFVLGVSFAFFLLGFGFTAAGQFFTGHRALLARIGGILVILFGLYQLGVFGSRLMGKERRLPFHLDRIAMNPAVALVLGFTFSFAWTPCVGPALASVLLMATSANSAANGFLLIAVYTIGFILPFLAVGLFTSTLLDFFKKHQKVVKYTVKVGGALMILMGVMMITGWMNGITGYLSSFIPEGGSTTVSQPVSSEPESTPSAGGGAPASSGAASSALTSSESAASSALTSSESAASSALTSSESAASSALTSSESASSESSSSEPNKIPAPDFTLTDQFGNKHSLSDYKGKVVFLNFWASWCGPCKSEMPDIEKLYLDHASNSGDVIVLGVAGPKTKSNQGIIDNKTSSELADFLKENGYTYPSLMDETGEVFQEYGVSAFPTTFMIDADGNVFGYVSGALPRDTMDNIIQQTIDGKQK